eukprot:4445142-Amphidinium_carterae.1
MTFNSYLVPGTELAANQHVHIQFGISSFPCRCLVGFTLPCLRSICLGMHGLQCRPLHELLKPRGMTMPKTAHGLPQTPLIQALQGYDSVTLGNCLKACQEGSCVTFPPSVLGHHTCAQNVEGSALSSSNY